MKKNFILMASASLSLCLLFVNCSRLTWWWCYVDSIGEETSNKTYFLESRLPDGLNPLIEKEYLRDLDITMSHLGYTKVDSADAAIKLAFGYTLGKEDVRSYTTSSPIYQYNPQTKTTSNTTITNTYGQEIAKVESTSSSGNKWGTIDIVGNSTNTSYEESQAITIMLDAFDVKTKEPVWSVQAYDEPTPRQLQDLRKLMPYYLLIMTPYVGKNSVSRQSSKIYFNDKRLQWYNP